MLDVAVHEVLGAVPAWFVENDPAASKVLAHHWPDVPNHGNVETVDWLAVEPVEVVVGGFPCTDVSSAGKRAGLRPGTRSGLWSQMRYAISQLQPKLVVIENVRGLLSADAHCDLEPCPWCVGDDEGRPLRACGAVVGDLASLGYVGRIRGLRASDIGAPHGRFRMFITAWPVADPDRFGPLRAGRTRAGWSGPTNDGESLTDPDIKGRWPGCGLGGRAGSAVAGDGAPVVTYAAGDGFQRLEERDIRSIEPGKLAPLRDDAAGRVLDWGSYAPAIARWERILGRPAPAPTQTGKRGGQQLSAVFTEWLMGWPEGWVTDVPGLSRNDQLKICGNGCVPQQVSAALNILLTPFDAMISEAAV